MKKIISIVFGWIFIQSVYGQDFHFSQFYATPLTLNPALTGQFDGAYRVTGIYRIQWNGVASSSYLYQTPSVSVDANFFKNRLGLGLVFLNDQTNDKLLNTLEGGASISYKILFERMQVSIGMQGWYSQSYLDFSRVQSSFQQAEPNANLNSQKFDFNSGLFGNYELNDVNRLYFGATVYHLLRPVDNFSKNLTNSTVPLKIMAHVGADLRLNDKINIIPGMFIARQAAASQVNFGTTLAYYLKRGETNAENKILYLGMWSRFNLITPQALIPKVGFEMNNIKATASYDFLMSAMRSEASASGIGAPNTFELSLSIILNRAKKYEDSDNFIFNPRF